MKKLYVVLTVLVALSMVLTACGTKSTPTAVPPTKVPPTAVVPPTATEPPVPAFTVGMVSDFGGVTDKSFNQSSWEGLQKAGTDLGVDYKFL